MSFGARFSKPTPPNRSFWRCRKVRDRAFIFSRQNAPKHDGSEPWAGHHTGVGALYCSMWPQGQTPPLLPCPVSCRRRADPIPLQRGSYMLTYSDRFPPRLHWKDGWQQGLDRDRFFTVVPHGLGQWKYWIKAAPPPGGALFTD